MRESALFTSPLIGARALGSGSATRPLSSRQHERSCRRGVDAEPLCLGARFPDRLVGDLELAEHVAGGGEPAHECVCTGHDHDDVLAVIAYEDDRHSSRRIDLFDVQSDAGFAKTGERFACIRVLADAADHADVGVEPGCGDGLVRSLAARYPFEPSAAHGLARSREGLDPCDEVEVDRPDDG